MNLYSNFAFPWLQTWPPGSACEMGDTRLPASIAVAEGVLSVAEDYTAKDINALLGFVQPWPANFTTQKKYFHLSYMEAG